MAASMVETYRAHWQDERDSVALYSALAEIEQNAKLAVVYRRLAESERRHADAWVERLKTAGASVPPFQPSWRTRMLIWLAKRFGAAAVLPTISSFEDQDAQGYTGNGMANEERSHARLLRQIGQTTRGGLEGSALAQLEGRHRTAGGNALRAAVLGANDGLVSNFSLVMGVAGAELSGASILITGMAGLLAGAISMALGEWISVQSSRELYEKQIRTEREELELAPAEEAEELALIYQARGLNEAAAQQLAQQLIGNRAQALETLAREELNIDPQELGGSAWEAAITSFVLFAVGAIVPVAPYFFLGGLNAVVVSALSSAVGLFLIGAAITLFTGRSVLWSGLRQMAFGLIAAAVTYGIGSLLGVSVGG